MKLRRVRSSITSRSGRKANFVRRVFSRNDFQADMRYASFCDKGDASNFRRRPPTITYSPLARGQILGGGTRYGCERQPAPAGQVECRDRKGQKPATSAEAPNMKQDSSVQAKDP